MVSQLSRLNTESPPSAHSSLVTAITGPRGSGKTLLMAFLCLVDMKRGKEVLSNVKIGGPLKRHGELIDVKSKPLNFASLLELNESLEHCVVGIDEINLWFAATRYMSHGNRIAGIFFQLLRKRQMSLYYTTQNFKWPDPNIRWQTDLHIACQDLFHTPGCKEENIGRGEFIRYVAVDRSGYLTGIPYEQSGNYTMGILDAKPIWPYYNTYEIINPWEAMAKVEIKRPTVVVDLTGEEGEEGDERGMPSPDSSDLDDARRYSG